MRLLGLDFETTGLAIGKIGITEVGLVLWDTDMRAPVKLAGFMVDPGPDAIWEPGTEKINGITPAFCSKYGIEDEKAARQTLYWYQNCDAAVAHNGLGFDRPMLKWWADKYGLDWQPNKLWIDTKADLEIPSQNSSKLVYMAADHQFLNPFPHRAVFDVMTMMKILDHYDLDKVLEVSKSASLLIKAIVDFENKEKAKTRGFHPLYEEGKFIMWKRIVKECNLDKERAACKETGFDIEVVGKL